MLKNLWQAYLEKGEVPKLLDLPLSDKGFLMETLHCIAPNAWSALGPEPLKQSREAFLYWLKGKSEKIKKKIGEEQFRIFNNNLEDILKTHLSAKEEN